MAVPASRFLRMKRTVDLLVSDSRTPGRGAVVQAHEARLPGGAGELHHDLAGEGPSHVVHLHVHVARGPREPDEGDHGTSQATSHSPPS